MFAYCGNNPVCASDSCGRQAEAVQMGNAVFVSGGDIAVSLGLLDAIIVFFSKLFSRSSKETEIPDSQKTNWDVEPNRENHILNGSKNHGGHGNGWKIMGIDPNDPGAWACVLKVIKDVVDHYDTCKTTVLDSGDQIYTYTKQFVNEGAEVFVRIWESAYNGGPKLSDAFVRIIVD